MKPLTPKEKKALRTALEIHSYYRRSADTLGLEAKTFLGRCPADITVARLRSLVEKHPEIFVGVAGVKEVKWVDSYYVPSGRGLFGRTKGGQHATNAPSRIRFEYTDEAVAAYPDRQLPAILQAR